jgi:hypothetical protein
MSPEKPTLQEMKKCSQRVTLLQEEYFSPLQITDLWRRTVERERRNKTTRVQGDSIFIIIGKETSARN